jgi:hypothetical protein
VHLLGLRDPGQLLHLGPRDGDRARAVGQELIPPGSTALPDHSAERRAARITTEQGLRKEHQTRPIIDGPRGKILDRVQRGLSRRR